MSDSFTVYADALAWAQQRANESCRDVAIRKVRAFGEVSYTVRIASWSDSDYSLAEIVQPEGGRLL